MQINIQLLSAEDMAHQRRERAILIAIFSLSTIGVGLLFWMGAASNAGKPIVTVGAIGMAFLLSLGVAVLVAVWYSRQP